MAFDFLSGERSVGVFTVQSRAAGGERPAGVGEQSVSEAASLAPICMAELARKGA